MQLRAAPARASTRALVDGHRLPLLIIASRCSLLGLATLFSAQLRSPGARDRPAHATSLSRCRAMWVVGADPAADADALRGAGLRRRPRCCWSRWRCSATCVNGARRWLHVGVTRIQPSEMMKIAVPLMLAWYFHRYEATLRLRDFVVAGAAAGRAGAADRAPARPRHRACWSPPPAST